MRPPLPAGLAALALVFASHGAAAAPQMLALVASATPIPIHCSSAGCGAELTAFCLEEGRDAPQYGTAYRTLRDQDITIVMRHSDGRLSRRPAAKSATLSSARGHSAIRLRLAPTKPGAAVPCSCRPWPPGRTHRGREERPRHPRPCRTAPPWRLR